MVLGANLFPIKAGAAHQIFDPTKTGLSQHPHFKLIGSGTPNEEIVKATLGLDLTDSLCMPKNLAELDKFFSTRCHDSMQRYTYLRVVGIEQLSRICAKYEFDSDLLILVVKCFNDQVINNLAFNNESE